MTLLHWKNGVVTEDPSETIAQTTAELRADQAHHLTIGRDLPRLKHELQGLKERAESNAALARSLAPDQGHEEGLIDALQKRLKNASSLPPGVDRDTRIARLSRDLDAHERALKAIKDRIARAKSIAKCTQALVDKFSEHNPGFEELLQQEKALQV